MTSFSLITAPVRDCGQFVQHNVKGVIIERDCKTDNMIQYCKLGRNQVSFKKLHVNQRRTIRSRDVFVSVSLIII